MTVSGRERAGCIPAISTQKLIFLDVSPTANIAAIQCSDFNHRNRSFVQLVCAVRERPVSGQSTAELFGNFGVASGHRHKPVRPVPHRLMAQVDPALEQEALDVAQRQRKPHVHHHHEGDYPWPGVEVAERTGGFAGGAAYLAPAVSRDYR